MLYVMEVSLDVGTPMEELSWLLHGKDRDVYR